MKKWRAVDFAKRREQAGGASAGFETMTAGLETRLAKKGRMEWQELQVGV